VAVTVRAAPTGFWTGAPRAWLADLILGGLFVIVGFVLLRLRRGAVQEVS